MPKVTINVRELAWVFIGVGDANLVITAIGRVHLVQSIHFGLIVGIAFGCTRRARVATQMMTVPMRRIGLAEASSCEWGIDETAIELRMGLA